MAGLVPNMYAVQQTGYLELELADWKDARLLVAYFTMLNDLLINFYSSLKCKFDTYLYMLLYVCLYCACL